ncbi:pre-mRNA-splicing factor CWC25 homolog [Episyrphus balteatus]|uniref:pre-mRNA-splicing factor CWC25 homolog n=1 Tax=Episyrphus balteatus TaxID=286459 RepID=UPI00248504DF|nr:pre-mRNA-splicing factor CWC25 homolog [Episyrphus balteatus]
MGGGDLNLKKSWHPHTMKNQEKVWKAEQAKNAEDRKMNDLRREIMEEKNREDLVKIGQSSGVLAKNDDKKLEWMYKSSSELINREDYLLGRPIDKAFELMEAEEKSQDMSGMKVPINHVEHECIPFSIRSYRNATTSSEQVDLQRKILEDPLMMIKQKEMESRRKILENPVKLKELHRILKIEKTKKSKGGDGQSSKKNKKSKKSKKKKNRGSDSDESDGSDKDLDKMLQKQYKKLKDKDSKQLGGLDLSKLLDAKYETISKELDKAANSKKKKGKSKKKSKNRSSSSDSSSGSESDSDGSNKMRDKFQERRSYRDKSRSPVGRKDQRRDRSSVDRRDQRRDRGSRSPFERRDQRRDRGSRSPIDRRDQRRDRESRSSVDRRDQRRDRDRQSPSERRNWNAGNRDRNYSSNYRADNRSQRRSRSPKKNDQSYNRTKSPPKTKTYSSNEEQKSKVSSQKQRLTEEEKEKRLKDMMDNAAWRDKERTRYVQNYREGYEKEEEQNIARGFDKEFINTQLRKAISTQNSVESRIKSNVNNIQRTSAAMNANFAKK